MAVLGVAVAVAAVGIMRKVGDVEMTRAKYLPLNRHILLDLDIGMRRQAMAVGSVHGDHRAADAGGRSNKPPPQNRCRRAAGFTLSSFLCRSFCGFASPCNLQQNVKLFLRKP